MTLLVPPEKLAAIDELDWSATVEINQDELLQLLPPIHSAVGTWVVAAARNYLHPLRVRVDTTGQASFSINGQPWSAPVGKPVVNT